MVGLPGMREDIACAETDQGGDGRGGDGGGTAGGRGERECAVELSHLWVGYRLLLPRPQHLLGVRGAPALRPPPHPRQHRRRADRRGARPGPLRAAAHRRAAGGAAAPNAPLHLAMDHPRARPVPRAGRRHPAACPLASWVAARPLLLDDTHRAHRLWSLHARLAGRHRAHHAQELAGPLSWLLAGRRRLSWHRRRRDRRLRARAHALAVQLRPLLPADLRRDGRLLRLVGAWSRASARAAGRATSG